MMNGEVVSHSVTVFSCSKSGVHNEKMSFRLTQEGTSSPVCSLHNEAPTQAQSRAADLTETESTFSRRSPCWSAEHLTPPLLHRAQVCLRPPPELPVSLCNGFSHPPLHANNGSALYSRQRRGARTKVAGKRSTRGMTRGTNSQNRKVTDFFPIRRSSRKSKTELKCEEKKLIDDLITNSIEEGMEVQHIEGKGRAVFATRCFLKGDYVVEYHGDLLQITDAKKREAEYAQNPATGCYMYYFQYLCKTYWLRTFSPLP